jgi:hypothetical protein
MKLSRNKLRAIIEEALIIESYIGRKDVYVSTDPLETHLIDLHHKYRRKINRLEKQLEKVESVEISNLDILELAMKKFKEEGGIYYDHEMFYYDPKWKKQVEKARKELENKKNKKLNDLKNHISYFKNLIPNQEN